MLNKLMLIEPKKYKYKDKLGNNQYEISGYEYIFNSNIDTSNLQDIHIQGKKVDDFHILNKNSIFTMNVDETQELYKIINVRQETIKNLINRIEILESKMI